jgi:MATE family multidrug resistance protein
MGGNKKKYISNIAFPTVVARVTQFGMYVVTQAFIGHLGELNLAAYAHIQIITVRFVNGIVVRFFIFLFFFFFFFRKA